MAEETQYTTYTGLTIVDTANSSLTGSGAISSIFTAGLNGALIKSVWIKAQEPTAQGMIRLFITGGGNTRLFKEIEVPAITPSATYPSFEVKLDLNFTLKAGYELSASTQNGQTFGIVTECLDWKYPTGAVRTDTTRYTAVSGLATIITANTNLDGTGSLAPVYSATGGNGSSIESITIKSTQTTSAGMVRIFVSNNNSMSPIIILLTEVFVPAIAQTGKVNAFEHTIVFDDDFELQESYGIHASTQNGEDFNLFAVGLTRTYQA